MYMYMYICGSKYKKLQHTHIHMYMYVCTLHNVHVYVHICCKTLIGMHELHGQDVSCMVHVCMYMYMFIWMLWRLCL